MTAKLRVVESKATLKIGKSLFADANINAMTSARKSVRGMLTAKFGRKTETSFALAA